MRCCGQKDHPTIGISRQPLQEIEALLSALVRSDAGMSLIHDDEIRTGTREALTALLRLNVVKADYGERISRK
jgi:hypothetical protein